MTALRFWLEQLDVPAFDSGVESWWGADLEGPSDTQF